MSHPQQKAISNAILSDLIIDCNFPLSIVENKTFHHVLTVLVSKYTPVCRWGEKFKVKNNTNHVSVTVEAKLDYIISDNAADMRKAFTVCFPVNRRKMMILEIILMILSYGMAYP